VYIEKAARYRRCLDKGCQGVGRRTACLQESVAHLCGQALTEAAAIAAIAAAAAETETETESESSTSTSTEAAPWSSATLLSQSRIQNSVRFQSRALAEVLLAYVFYRRRRRTPPRIV